MNLYIDVKSTYNAILEDLEKHSSELFQRVNYFSRKYRGDRFNDISVLFEYGYNGPVTLIVFIKNKTGYIKTRVYLTSDRKSISHTELLNISTNE